MPRAFTGCVICHGKSGNPRNGKRGATCSGSKCKDEYKEQRAQGSQPAAGLAVAADALAAEKMPDGMWVHEVEEILGERCCELHLLSKKKRKNGPGGSYMQEFLVRGSFLEDDGDNSDEDDTPEPNTFWVEKAILLDTIARDDVKAALVARHERVLDEV